MGGNDGCRFLTNDEMLVVSEVLVNVGLCVCVCIIVLQYQWVVTMIRLHTATHCNTLQHTATHCNTHGW